MKRRHLVGWTARLLIGVALGFGARVSWERKPAVRFATGLAILSLRGPPGEEGGQTSHLQAGVPVRFSLDEITTAPEPALALRAWCEALAAATPDARRHCLTVPVEASLTALRRCVTLLARDAGFREAFLDLSNVLSDTVASDSDPELLQRSFAELARMDPTLALDGAETSGDEAVKRAVWIVIAEDDPQRVIDLVGSGQAPPEVMELAVASLAARSPEAADAAMRNLPEGEQAAAAKARAQALAAVDPVGALSRSPNEGGQPDQAWVELLVRHVPATKAVDLLLAIEKGHPDLLKSCSESLAHLVGQQARRDPEFALGWFQRCVPPGPSMSHSAREVLLEVARQQPRAAAEALAAWPDGPAREDASARIAASWMGSRPFEALDWISRQANATALLEKAAGSPELKPEDAVAVADWFSRQGRGTDPGWGVVNLARARAVDDPTGAVAWATALADPDKRDQAVGAAFHQWMMVDPVAAEPRLREQAADNPGLLLALGSGSSEGESDVIQKLLFENLQSIIALSPSHSMAEFQIGRTLNTAVWQPDTREEALRVLAELPDPALQQKILSGIARDGANDLSLVRRVTGMMTDHSEATRLMEISVERAFFQ